jgi:hypothetical protein
MPIQDSHPHSTQEVTMSIPASSENVRRKPGRPALAFQTEPVTVRLTPDTLARLDDWRRGQNDLPTRPEAFRRLMELGLRQRDPHGAAA